MPTLRTVVLVSSLLAVTTPTFAATDYHLQLDPVQGEAKGTAATQSIEVEGFSWGASNSGTAAKGTGGGTGKVNVQDISLMKTRAPRDASTGMSSGKRVASEAAAVDGQPVTAAAPPKVGDVATFTVVTRNDEIASAAKAGACAGGKHFAHAVLVARGQRYEFSDVTETSCTVADGQIRKNYTGHVTLMK